MRVIKIQEENNSSYTPPLTPVATFTEKKRGQAKIALPTMEGIELEYIESIASLEAQGNYTLIHFMHKKPMLVSKTLRELENRVNNDGNFLRIHRSHSINLNRLEKYIRGKGGYVLLENGKTISVSISRKQSFLHDLKSYFE